MNPTELWLQMTMAATQLNQAMMAMGSTASGSAASSGSSFQEMLEDKRTQASGGETAERPENQPQKPASEKPADSQEGTEASDGQVQKPQTGEKLPDAVAALGAALVLPTPVQPTAEAAPVPEDAAFLPMTATDPAIPAAAAAEQPVYTAEPAAAALQPAAADVRPQTVDGQPVLQKPAVQTAEPAANPVQPEAAQPADRPAQPAENRPEGQTARQDAESLPQAAVLAQAEPTDTPVFAEAEVQPVKVGDGAVLDTESPQMDTQLRQTVEVALDAGAQKVEIRLQPESLGRVVVEMTRSDAGILHVVLHTENERAANLLRDHAGTLGMMLQGGGQGEVHVEVTQPQERQQFWQQQPGQHGNSQEQSQQQQQQRPRQEEAEKFLHQLRLGLVQLEELGA